ncbi:MAG: phosphotransferase [Brevefilum sp.]|nr:phosphotransferase [Brevefilum sp.]
MEIAIRDSFNQNVLETALNRYRIALVDATILDGFESFIFKVRRDGNEYILRIGHSARRSAELIQGEAEFINHLRGGGLSVPQVLPSCNHLLVEAIEAQDGAFFLATLFEKAPGHTPKESDWCPALYQSMGQFMGRLHTLSKAFQPSLPRYQRFSITEDFEAMENAGRKYLPAEDQPVLQAYLDTVAAIQQLPQEVDSYGLCHIDFHGGNFFITDEGLITLFDFDDCQYAWFVYDIAMALFYAISHDCASEAERQTARTFLSSFWSGYAAEHNLALAWLEYIPYFLRLREIDLYMLIHRSMDMDNLDPWCASYMEGRREKIINSEPYCALDYASIAAKVHEA